MTYYPIGQEPTNPASLAPPTGSPTAPPVAPATIEPQKNWIARHWRGVVIGLASFVGVGAVGAALERSDSGFDVGDCVNITNAEFRATGELNDLDDDPFEKVDCDRLHDGEVMFVDNDYFDSPGDNKADLDARLTEVLDSGFPVRMLDAYTASSYDASYYDVSVWSFMGSNAPILVGHGLDANLDMVPVDFSIYQYG